MVSKYSLVNPKSKIDFVNHRIDNVNDTSIRSKSAMDIVDKILTTGSNQRIDLPLISGGRPGSSAIDSSVSQHCPTQSINVHLKGERNIVSLPESHVVPQQADSSFITEESHFLLGLIVSVDIAVDIT